MISQQRQTDIHSSQIWYPDFFNSSLYNSAIYAGPLHHSFVFSSYSAFPVFEQRKSVNVSVLARFFCNLICHHSDKKVNCIIHFFFRWAAMQCNQSTSAFSKISVSRFPENLNSKVEIYPNFCPSSIVPIAIALAIEVLRKLSACSLSTFDFLVSKIWS